MLSHRAIMHNCRGAADALKEILKEDEVFLSFLPLSHSYEHIGAVCFPTYIGAQVYFAEGLPECALSPSPRMPYARKHYANRSESLSKTSGASAFFARRPAAGRNGPPARPALGLPPLLRGPPRRRGHGERSRSQLHCKLTDTEII